jgi:Phage terminase large subunit
VTAVTASWMGRIVGQAARAAADDLDQSGSRLWRRAGWTATLPGPSRISLDGPAGARITYDLPGVDLPAALGLTTCPADPTPGPPAGTVHTFEPHGAALEAMHATDGEVLLSGPAGTGKSRAALERLHLLALANPMMRGLIVRKTAVSLGSSALVTWREKVIPEAKDAGLVRFYGGSREEASGYRYVNGSVINLGGMDNPTRIMSTEYDCVFVQEAIEITEDAWESITSRLRNGRLPWQFILADTNPDKPTHWLNVRCDRGDTRMLHCRHSDNPTIVDPVSRKPTRTGAAYLARLDKLTGVRRARLRDGRWVAAEGIIYEDFDPAVHCSDRFPVPPEWTRWWAIDFGYTNPFVCQCWAEDPDGRLWLEWEVYHTGRTVDQHAVTILDQVTEPVEDYEHPDGEPRRAHHGRRWVSPRPRAVICDHDAEGRAVLARELGMSTRPARKQVKDGIEAVQARLRKAPDGRPRLYILRDGLVERDTDLEDAKKPCSTLEEFPGYVWDTSTGAVKAAREQPVKEDDHGMDTTRYVVAEKDLGGRARVRWL